MVQSKSSDLEEATGRAEDRENGDHLWQLVKPGQWPSRRLPDFRAFDASQFKLFKPFYSSNHRTLAHKDTTDLFRHLVAA